MISPHNEWYIGNVLVCAHFSSKLEHGTYFYALLRSYLDFLGKCRFFPMLMSKPCSSGLKRYTVDGQYMQNLNTQMYLHNINTALFQAILNTLS